MHMNQGYLIEGVTCAGVQSLHSSEEVSETDGAKGGRKVDE